LVFQDETTFGQLTRSLYSLANCSATLHSLSTNLLRVLFVNLKDDALLFLAGIWSDSSNSSIRRENLRLSALSHAKAFLIAHAQTRDKIIDFQVIVPALLAALNSPERRVRSVALENLSLIQNMCGAKTRSSVYAIDSVYGKNSGTLFTFIITWLF
jgi:U3 small nucleolar RNA-associated protein 10